MWPIFKQSLGWVYDTRDIHVYWQDVIWEYPGQYLPPQKCPQKRSLDHRVPANYALGARGCTEADADEFL